ncbi:alcohol dehydrogenase catalytic domain-containing protein [Streptomyces apricus]|uniref:2-deoxy-scyllo-inosamine dehydrogenase n=1 Tax=Streptomyces apricus TaxID=1828112 RepID=A0A5A9ZUH3_9ACTN|nr:alcohol dehydrogenase catalytic domain-containing protein [Streptomyces apricus]KAA0920566.1 alcohol dehydrogenase [Streptomyces apricus]
MSLRGSDLTQARRARFHGNNSIEVGQEVLPELAIGEVRVAVEISALCGSDKRLYRDGSVVVPGHEIAGRIVETSHDVPSCRVGERGVVYAPVFCGACASCAIGFTNGCLKLVELIGWQRDGGYATHVDVPVRCFVPIPDSMPLDVAVLGLDTVGTAAHGLRWAIQTRMRAVERVAVIGCGPLGLGVAAMSLDMGLPTPEVFDPIPSRLEAAMGVGARRLHDLDVENQFDIVVEASGSRAAREIAQRLVRPGAVLLALGESDEPFVIPANPRTRRTNLFTLRTFYFPMSEVEDNWAALSRVGPQLLSILGSPASLAELPEVFVSFSRGELLKPIIRFDEIG